MPFTVIAGDLIVQQEAVIAVAQPSPGGLTFAAALLRMYTKPVAGGSSMQPCLSALFCMSDSLLIIHPIHTLPSSRHVKDISCLLAQILSMQLARSLLLTSYEHWSVCSVRR
jgi:hypothetical protein